MPSPIYKDRTGRLTNLPGPDEPTDTPDVSNYGRGSTEDLPQTGWEGQGILDAAKAEATKSDSVTQGLDAVNSAMFPRASAAKAAHPDILGDMVSSQDYADVERQLQNAENQRAGQSSIGGRVAHAITPDIVNTAATIATPFVGGPAVTIPAALAANTALDMARSHYHDPSAPQRGSEYAGDAAMSTVGPLIAGGTASLGALGKLAGTDILSKPGLVPAVLGTVHGYRRGGWEDALLEGGAGYWGGQLAGKLGSLQKALSPAEEAVEGAEAAGSAAGAADTGAEGAAEAETAPEPPAKGGKGVLMRDSQTAASPEDVLRKMGGRFSDREAGFSDAMVEKMNGPASPGLKALRAIKNETGVPHGPFPDIDPRVAGGADLGVPKPSVTPSELQEPPPFEFQGEAGEPGHPPTPGGVGIDAPWQSSVVGLRKAVQEPSFEDQLSSFGGAGHPESADYTSRVLKAVAPTGQPGVQMEGTGLDQHLVYRGPDGKAVAAARIVKDVQGNPLVMDLATDKSKGMLSGRAAVAIGQKLKELGISDAAGTMSNDALNLRNRLR
jgi:hypothetical protein